MKHLFKYIYRITALVGISALLVPLFDIFTVFFIPFSSLLRVSVVLSAVLLGGLFTDITLALTHHSREDDDFEFSTSIITVPLMLSAAVSVLAFFGAGKYFIYAFQNELIDFYDPRSMYPFLFALLYFVCMAVSVAVGSMPYKKLGSYWNLIVGSCIFIAYSIIALFFLPVPSAVIAVSYAAYILAVIVMMNQSYIVRGYRGSGVSVITNGARMYNLMMGVIMGAFILIGAVFTGLFVNGIWTVIRAVLVVLVFSALQEESGDTYYGDSSGNSGGSMSAGLLEGSAGDAISLIFVLFLFVMTVTFLIMGRQKGKNIFTHFIDFINSIGEWIKMIFESVGFFLTFDRNYDSKYTEVSDYKDTERKLQRHRAKDYVKLSETLADYGEFARTLNSLPDYGKQLSFAYLTLMRLYRARGINIKLSDTPREAAQKIKRGEGDPAVTEEITSVLELVKYAEENPGDSRRELALHSICDAVKRYIG